MKFILLTILLLPLSSFAESAQMTLQALESMQRADANARRICENIRREPECVEHVQEMRTALGLSTIACHARFNSLNCENVVHDNYPEFAEEIATCSNHDVCQQALVSTFGRGCGRFGIELKDQFVATVQGVNACVQNWRCAGAQILNGVMTILNPGRAIARAAQSTIQSVRDDFNRAQVMGCFNSVTQAQFMCHLMVKYGMAVATGGRAAMMLGRMGSLEALIKMPGNVLLRARRLAAQRSQTLAQSGGFRQFRQGRGEKPITLRPGESYTAIISHGKVVLGERYVNRNPGADSRFSQTHLMLYRDANNGRQPPGTYLGGTIRLNRDGSFDVSGFRQKKPHPESEAALRRALELAVPGVRIRSTPDRLSTLPRR